MPPQAPPLDEQEWENPHILRELPGGVLTTDNLYWYFSWSPYYESTCANTALWTQIQKQPEGIHIMLNRQRFEELLERDYPVGLRYMIVGEPLAPGQPWVIQRQNRVRNPETDEIEVTVEGTYYVQGIKILQAPSLLDVLQTRLLQVSQCLSDFFELGKNLSHWSPATGHTYLPASYEPKAGGATAAGSRIGSPTLAPEADGASQGQPGSQQQPGGAATAETLTTDFSDDLFLSSLHLTNRYGNEFMDENPLRGEPGAFVFSNTLGHVDARNRAAQAAAQNQAAAAASSNPANSAISGSNQAGANIKSEIDSTANSVAPTPRPTATGTPLPAAGDAQNRKPSLAGLPTMTTKEKKERRKSKGLNSPVTPTVP
ncbi:hypothetical protein BS50DRAFT_214458 [Corynespora cassiicola Philippines]|uniref:Mediator of RNA polymerase II transcription subunit 6 n=1 Tax=Corynespora cassiicola Philippines TaxID=1448308 RepID=A0A2T2N4B8_CORCC|nr:hypothetical protein BS50DRAFT_214458 [Corynespora cassiicola Philippines]